VEEEPKALIFEYDRQEAMLHHNHPHFQAFPLANAAKNEKRRKKGGGM
jgi:hypothetical protein